MNGKLMQEYQSEFVVLENGYLGKNLIQLYRVTKNKRVSYTIYNAGMEVKHFPSTNNTNGKIAAENYFDGYVNGWKNLAVKLDEMSEE